MKDSLGRNKPIYTMNMLLKTLERNLKLATPYEISQEIKILRTILPLKRPGDKEALDIMVNFMKNVYEIEFSTIPM